VAEINNDDADLDLIAESLVAELLAETASFGDAIPWRDTPSWLLRARDYIQNHHLKSLRLNEIAEAVDIHPVHLARRYRQFSGRPVGEHLRQLRVDTARDRLRGTDQSLADIAAECGFSDQAHFGRVFRRFTGTTPARYRAGTS
jgi:AraC family transcriptional regulator